MAFKEGNLKLYLTLEEYSDVKASPGWPKSNRRRRDVLDRRAAEQPEKKQKRPGTKAFEYHYSLLPEQALKEFLLKHPEIALQGQFQAPEKIPSISKQRPTKIDREALWDHFARKPQEAKDRAQKRLEAVQAVETLIAHGMKKGDAKEAVVQQLDGKIKISFASLGKWMKQIEGHHRSDWLPLLADSYSGRKAEAEIAPEAWDYFKADYLRLEAPAASACYERLERVAKVRGWSVPSLKTITRKIDREIPRPALILAREGEEALKRAYPSQTRDHGFYKALEAVNADGHKFDVFVRFPDGEIGRPVMVAWQDIFSGKILSYRTDKTENTDSVRLSYGDMVEVYGIPGHGFLDNGRGFASKWMTGGIPNRYRFKVKEDEPAGIMTMMGVQVHWTTPYHGQAKPIERAFLDLAERVSKHPAFAGAYCGNKPDAKPENCGSRAVPLEKFLEVLEEEIIAHNARTGRRSAVCNGRSLDEVFNESYARSSIRKATAEQRRLWLLAAEGITASKQDGSISLLNNRYYADFLAQHAGQKLVIRFDPENLHQGVHVYQLDGRYLGQADCLQAAGFGDTQAAREHNRLRNQHRKAAKEQLKRERRMTALEAAEMLPKVEKPAPAGSRVVQPFFRKQGADDNETHDDRFDRAMRNIQKPRKSLLEY